MTDKTVTFTTPMYVFAKYTVMGGEVHLDIYDDRIATTSPGGMYSGQKVQDLQLDEISSERRNPVLADIMAQLDYMEKRGSGLKKICKETKKLKTYKDERKPLFKSTATQFMTIIYSMEYETSKQSSTEETGTKLGLSREQVGTKLGLSWDEVEKLFVALQQPRSMSELKELYGWRNTLLLLLTRNLLKCLNQINQQVLNRGIFLQKRVDHC